MTIHVELLPRLQSEITPWSRGNFRQPLPLSNFQIPKYQTFTGRERHCKLMEDPRSRQAIHYFRTIEFGTIT